MNREDGQMCNVYIKNENTTEKTVVTRIQNEIYLDRLHRKMAIWLPWQPQRWTNLNRETLPLVCVCI